MTKTSLTKFESDLVRLSWVSNRFEILYDEFAKIPQVPNQYGFKSILREYIIIQLYNFILIRFRIVQNLADYCLGKQNVFEI